MKDFESLAVISVEFFCKVNPAFSKWLTVENIDYTFNWF